MHLSRLFGISLLLTHGCTDSPADTPPSTDGSGSGSGAGEEGTGTGGDDTGEGSGDDTGQATPYEWPECPDSYRKGDDSECEMEPGSLGGNRRMT